VRFATRRVAIGVLLSIVFGAGVLHAQGVRDRTRPDAVADTAVSESQARDLTLTLTAVSRRTLQTWVRAAGVVDDARGVLTATLDEPEADLIQVGQRVRAFPPTSVSSMYQAEVTRVSNQGDRVVVDASIKSGGREGSRRYVMEILVDRGRFLSVPNEAIIEEGGSQVVYLQTSPGTFVPRVVETGLVGELYTEIRGGVEEGGEVVTLGSFFIDAEHKLNFGGQNAMGDAHQDH